MINGWLWVLVNLYQLQTIFAHDRVYLGLSGGLDSMVLLHYLSILPHAKGKLSAIHVNHGLSPQAGSWETFCIKACQARQIPLQVEHVFLDSRRNLEARARQARYEVYAEVVAKNQALILAHHLDDQLETFLLNAIRGTGLTGLAAMPQHRVWRERHIYRPLLDVPRSKLSAYAQEFQLTWIEDESNQNLDFSRNYLRHEIFPRLAKIWPDYRQSMAHTIESCQNISQYLSLDVLNHVTLADLKQSILALDSFKFLNEIQIFEILRLWFRHQELPIPTQGLLQQILQQVLHAKRPDSNPKLIWGGCTIYAYRQKLYCMKPLETLKAGIWADFPEPGFGIKVILAEHGVAIDEAHDRVEVRYRQGGELLLYRGHHRELKKMFQEAKVPPFLRDRIPLIYVNGTLKAVVGYWYADEADAHLPNYQFCS
jgi:tRNA(Ile)-lysidine synthase